MPITIKTAQVNVKNSQGDYVSINGVAEETTAQQVANITAAGAQQITAIQTKGEQTRASIPEDYTNLSDEVTDLKSALSKQRK